MTHDEEDNITNTLKHYKGYKDVQSIIKNLKYSGLLSFTTEISRQAIYFPKSQWHKNTYDIYMTMDIIGTHHVTIKLGTHKIRMNNLTQDIISIENMAREIKRALT